MEKKVLNSIAKMQIRVILWSEKKSFVMIYHDLPTWYLYGSLLYISRILQVIPAYLFLSSSFEWIFRHD